jgi:hypothetical protein
MNIHVKSCLGQTRGVDYDKMSADVNMTLRLVLSCIALALPFGWNRLSFIVLRGRMSAVSREGLRHDPKRAGPSLGF